MKIKEQQLEEYIEYLYGDIEEHDKPIYVPDIYQSRRDFTVGYNSAIEKVKEYLFNTENHPENISEEYLKQTIEFLK